MAGAHEDVAQAFLLLLGNRAQPAVEHQLRKSDNAVQRRAKLVGNSRQETVLGRRGGPRRLQRPAQLLVLVAHLHGVLRHLARGHGRQVALGNIHQRAAYAGYLAALAADRALADLHPDARSVVERVIAFEGPGIRARRHARQHGLAKAVAPLGVHKVPRFAAQHLVRRALQQLAGRLVETRDRAVPVNLLVGNRRPVEQFPVAPLALLQASLPFTAADRRRLPVAPPARRSRRSLWGTDRAAGHAPGAAHSLPRRGSAAPACPPESGARTTPPAGR